MELYWNRNIDPSWSPCLMIVGRKRFEQRHFLVLCPVLLEIAYFNSANWELSNDVLPKKQKSDIAVIFLSFSQSCWNCIFKLSNAVRLVKFRRKVAVHIFLGWSQAGLPRPPLCRNYRKPHLFCLRSYPGEFAHSNSANRQLSIAAQVVERG